MENFKLSGNIREDAGKGVARKIRFAGSLPACFTVTRKTR